MFPSNSKHGQLDWIEDSSRNMDYWSWHAEHSTDDGRNYVCGIDIFFGGQEGRAAIYENASSGGTHLIDEILTDYDNTDFDLMANWCEQQLGL